MVAEGGEARRGVGVVRVRMRMKDGWIHDQPRERVVNEDGCR
jgi:hypothetical protein